MKSPGMAWYLVYVLCSVLLLSRGMAINGEEMYRYRDADGTWILSDTRPPPGSETQSPPKQKSQPPAPLPMPGAAPMPAVAKPKNVVPKKTSVQPPIRPSAQPPGTAEAPNDRHETPDSIEIGPSSTRVEAGRVIIEGTVHNRDRTRTLRSVTIIMMAYNQAGALVGVPAVSPQPRDLAPGQIGTYSVRFPPHVRVYRYKPRVMWRE